MDKARIQRILEMAQGHVELGERHITRQREIVEELDGSDQHAARALLKTFEDLQVTHVADRDRLQRLLDTN